MVTCPNCTTQTTADAFFCPECGKALKHQAERQPEPASPIETLGAARTIGDEHTRPPRPDAPTSPDLEKGARFADRYIIDDIVGRGGMGVVYRAQDTIADKTVALKLIRPDRAGNDAAIKRLIAEGTTARDIRHKNVVAVYDVGEVGGQAFLSMEYLDHPSLRAWHRKKTLKPEAVPLRVAARIIAELLDGLKAAHDAGVVHRDLKPENIILTAEPTDKAAPLKILDFGIANISGAVESGTGTGLGTPRYMAPEQITNPGAAAPSADIYSLSVIFYELLMDVLPMGHWQPPSSGRADVPQSIDVLIETGLSNRPATRPQSAPAYRQELVISINHPDRSKPKPKPRPKSKPQPSTNDAKPSQSVSPVLKWIGGITAAIIALAIIRAVIEEGESPSPDNNPYAQLSGTWYLDDGSPYNVQVTRSGTFNFSSQNGQIIGALSGQSGELTFIMNNSADVFEGPMQIEGDHIKYDLFADDGTLVFRERIHLNHPPS